VSTRALGRIAVLLGVLLLAALTLGVKRLGYFSDEAARSIEFLNPTLDTVRGQRVVFRPVQQGAQSRRFWAAVVVSEPEVGDPVFAFPHIRVGVEVRAPNASGWTYRPPVSFVSLARMGALRSGEYLADIRWVREHGRDGSERDLICATYGDFEGKQIVYYFDPDRPVPIVGWIRREQHRDEPPPDVHFADDGGDLPVD